MNEIVIELQPKQQEFRKAIEQYQVTLYGGAKGGGKSHGMREIILLRRFQYPGSSGVIFRRTYPELEANHIRPLFAKHPYLRAYWNESKKLLSLPNGSTLQFCYCGSESDVDSYQGWEIHDLGIEEAGQWSETMIRRLRGSNRSSKPGIRPRTILTGNPGGIGHGYLKRVFVERRFKAEEKAGDYHFIQALVTDNPALLDNDPDYVFRLDNEPNEALRKAFRYGDWNVFAGQFFQEITKDIHFIDPFTIPRHWNRFGAYDFGFNHPSAFGWFANDEDGNVFLYRELYRAGMRVDQFAQELNKFDDTKDLSIIPAGLDCWTTKNVLKTDLQPPTIAEEFWNHGIKLDRATIDRVQGANQLRNYLAWQGRPNKRPRLYIFNNCPITFDCLSRMIHDPDRVEDVLKVDATEGDPLSGDDGYDMVRYGLMSRPMLTMALKPHPSEISEQERMHIEAAQEKVKREQNPDVRGEYGSWEKDKKGVASWNQW